MKTGRNGHIYVHARSQEANWQQDPATGKWMYIDYKNIMIETTESLKPYIEAIKIEVSLSCLSSNALLWTEEGPQLEANAVSYTHLTLPTICSV